MRKYVAWNAWIGWKIPRNGHDQREDLPKQRIEWQWRMKVDEGDQEDKKGVELSKTTIRETHGTQNRRSQDDGKRNTREGNENNNNQDRPASKDPQQYQQDQQEQEQGRQASEPEK